MRKKMIDYYMDTVPRSRFTEHMVRANGLDRLGFQAWVFVPSMLFKAKEKWWGAGGKRTTAHEGIDLCLFGNASGDLFRLNGATRIPAMYDGCVVAIIDDFVGSTIVIEHRFLTHKEPVLTIYGHLVANETLSVGSAVEEAQIIGTLAHPGRSRVHIYPHLHASVALPAKRATYTNLTWQDLGNSELFTMTDPLDVLGGPYRVINRFGELGIKP